jgi:hypothetical protein
VLGTHGALSSPLLWRLPARLLEPVEHPHPLPSTISVTGEVTRFFPRGDVERSYCDTGDPCFYWDLDIEYTDLEVGDLSVSGAAS